MRMDICFLKSRFFFFQTCDSNTVRVLYLPCALIGGNLFLTSLRGFELVYS